MGIAKGSNFVVSLLSRHGAYRRRDVRHFDIRVDGELVRYKGQTPDNMHAEDAENAVAHSSAQYLAARCRDIESLVGCSAETIFVYLDGERIANKSSENRHYENLLDASRIRVLFAEHCRRLGMQICALSIGESELQMYKERDRAKQLNVFFTNDCDMASICYDHRTQRDEAGSVEVCDEEDQFMRDSGPIHDANMHVDTARDSCLWVKCGSKSIPEAFGMDDVSLRVGLSPRAFRVFVGLCGTDYTRYMFTDTMVAGITAIIESAIQEHQVDSDLDEATNAQRLQVHERNSRDIEFVNRLTDSTELAAALLYLGIRGRGTLMKLNPKSVEARQQHPFSNSAVRNMLDWYIEYVELGVMPEAAIQESAPQPCMDLVTRVYVAAMQARPDLVVLAPQTRRNRQTKRDLERWADATTLSRAIGNFRRTIGRAEGNSSVGPEPLAAGVADAQISAAGAKKPRDVCAETSAVKRCKLDASVAADAQPCDK